MEGTSSLNELMVLMLVSKPEEQGDPNVLKDWGRKIC